ncbi:MAG TPA: ribosome maturation factor RimM [Burkholderiaceae bacterium]|nr:ribosome maturation factor RimM [Burkholderiaceae bacterium]
MPPGKQAVRSLGAVGADAAPPADLVELGVIRGAYGVKGWVRIAPHDIEAAVLRATRHWWLEQGGKVSGLEVTGVRRHGGGIVAKWVGCDDPETAERLRGAQVHVGRSDFPALAEGEFYWVDLVGARVLNRAGVELGKVTGLRNNGAQDMLEVARAEQPEVLIPLVEAYVDAIDAKGGLIRVDWEVDW